jgi:hypothetical protein
MAIRYYPTFRLKTNLNTSGGNLLLNGRPYRGRYYATYDGKFFSGPNPVIGPNEPLELAENYVNQVAINSTGLTGETRRQFAINTKSQNIDLSNSVEPTSYFSKPLESEYAKGYFYRYFVKRINDRGYVKEISEQEYLGIEQGTVPYDVSYYQIVSLLWKLTGPLNTVRLSQYDIRAGIIDTNKRLVETIDARFIGLKAFIGEEYSKFARPSQTGEQTTQTK